MSGLSSTGFSRPRLDQLFSDLVAQFQAIFGVDINVDPQAIDGQHTGIYSESQSNLWQLLEAIYQSVDPDTATGAALSRLVRINGISRNLGSFSTVGLTFSGTAGTSIPIGQLVTSNDNSSVWITIEAGTLDVTGNVTLSAQCTILGPVEAQANTLQQRTTPVFGWTSVTNEFAASPGSAQETDQALRIRRNVSTSAAAQSIPEAIIGAVLNLTGVTQGQLYENDADTPDGNGLPPHSFYVVVQGGDNTDIANTIWQKKSTGATMVGSTVITITDKYNGQHPIQFDRPSLQLVYLDIGIRIRAGFPSSGDTDIRNNIVAWSQSFQTIGLDVFRSEIFTPINLTPSLSIQYLKLSFSPSPTAEVDLDTPFNGLALFDVSRIAIEHV